MWLTFANKSLSFGALRFRRWLNLHELSIHCFTFQVPLYRIAAVWWSFWFVCKWLYRQVISVNGGKYRTNYAAHFLMVGRPSPSGSPEKPQGLAPSLPRTRHLRCVNDMIEWLRIKVWKQLWRSTTANSWVKQHVKLRNCHKCSVFCQEWVASVVQL